MATFALIIVPVAAVLAGVAKLTKNPKVIHSVHEVCGVPMDKVPMLAGLEIAGGLGAVLGLWIKPLGVAALIGLALYFVGATVAHLRVKDMKGIAPALLLAVLAVVAAVLRVSA